LKEDEEEDKGGRREGGGIFMRGREKEGKDAWKTE
jgi:hypothetical protein